MLRQYGPQRYRMADLPDGSRRPVGTIEAGTIFRLAVRLTPYGRPVLRPYIVETWLSRRISGYRVVGFDRPRRYEDVFVARGGHLARVRCLADGSRTTMADHLIARAVEDDVRGEWLPMPPALPKHERWRFRRARTRCGTRIDLGRAA